MDTPTTPNEFLELINSFEKNDKIEDETKYRYVIYTRKSTDEDDKQVRSLEDQVTECRDFAAAKNLRVIDVIEEAESAKEPDIRPKFRQMLKDIVDDKYDGVIAWHPDRLARNMKDAGEFIDLVDKRIVRDLKFVSFTFKNDTSGKMLLGITFVLSKEYSDKLSDDVRRGNKHSIEDGKYINTSKHGYYKDKNQQLHPDGDNFVLIKDAFKLRLEGKSLDEIAEYLKSKGYFHRNKLDSEKCYNMDKQRLKKIFVDPVYTGILRYGKATVTTANLMELYNFVPAVSVKDFWTINKITNDAQFARLAKSYRKGDKVKARLLKGRVFCAECGEPMTAGITPKRNKSGVIVTKYFYYRCDDDNCPRYGKSVRAKVVMDYIKEYLASKPFSSKESYDHYEQEMKLVHAQRIHSARGKLSELKGEKRTLETRFLKTKDLLIGDESESVKKYYRDDLQKMETKMADIDSKVDKINDFINNSKESVYTYSQFLELMENMPKNIAIMKNMDELDTILGKIFLNFTLSAKKVENITLNTPFDMLESHKILKGAEERT